MNVNFPGQKHGNLLGKASKKIAKPIFQIFAPIHSRKPGRVRFGKPGISRERRRKMRKERQKLASSQSFFPLSQSKQILGQSFANPFHVETVATSIQLGICIVSSSPPRSRDTLISLMEREHLRRANIVLETTSRASSSMTISKAFVAERASFPPLRRVDFSRPI